MAKRYREDTAGSIEIDLASLRLQLSNIISDLTYAQNNSEYTIARLQSLAQESCRPLLKKLADTKSDEGLRLLGGVLEIIGDITQEIGALSSRAKQSTSLKHYTDAAIFHQYVISILSERDITDRSKLKVVEQYHKLDQIKSAMLSKETSQNNIYFL